MIARLFLFLLEKRLELFVEANNLGNSMTLKRPLEDTPRLLGVSLYYSIGSFRRLKLEPFSK